MTVLELPVATELAGVNMRLKPGGIRELHWHKEAEWAFMLAGRARITAVDERSFAVPGASITRDHLDSRLSVEPLGQNFLVIAC